MRPRFSIILPTKNRANLLQQAVQSVVAQTFTDWELIVLDNGTPVHEFLPPDPRIRYFHEEASGPADAFNRALAKAQGEIIHPFADDDLLAPKALAVIDRTIGDADWIYGRTSFEQKGVRQFSIGEPFSLNKLKEDYNLGGAVYWRKTLTDKLGGFNVDYEGAADYELYLRFAEHSTPRFVGEVLYRYNDHEGADTRKNQQRQELATSKIKVKERRGRPTTDYDLSDVTVVIPFKRGGREDWLRAAIATIPQGVEYLVAENDGELHEALNQAFREAKTEFVFRLDADDALHDECLDFLHSLIWDVDVTYPSLLYTFDELTPYEYHKAAAFCPNRLLEMNYVPGTALFRRDAVLEVGGYREMDLLEDWDLHVRLFRAGKKFKGVPEAVYLYRQHADSRNRVPHPDVTDTRAHYRELICGPRLDLRATWYHQASFATTYWRCLLPARWLPGKALPLPEVRRKGEDSLEFPEHVGAAIWQFPGDGGRAVMMLEQQLQGTRVLVETDDNYFDLSPQGSPGWGKKVRGNWHSLEAHGKIVPHADGVIVTTDQLRKRYSKLNPNVYVCPNQIDPSDWPAPREQDGVFRVGWFASPSHVKDPPLIRRALEWASEQPGIEVVTMGLDPGWKFRRKHVPWSNDMGVYRQILRLLDVGLAPVIEDPWSVCRSDLKALEYAMAGVAPVLSDAIPYKTYKGPCLRATDARSFLRHVQHLVTNPDEARMLAQSAREFVLKERTYAQNIWRWETAVDDRRTGRAVA